jgi:hypothetical protein
MFNLVSVVNCSSNAVKELAELLLYERRLNATPNPVIGGRFIDNAAPTLYLLLRPIICLLNAITGALLEDLMELFAETTDPVTEDEDFGGDVMNAVPLL